MEIGGLDTVQGPFEIGTLQGQDIGFGILKIAVKAIGQKALGLELFRGIKESFFEVGEVTDLLADEKVSRSFQGGMARAGKGPQKKKEASKPGEEFHPSLNSF